MAANVYIFQDGAKATNIFFNGTKVFDAYHNGIHTYTSTLRLILPQYLNTIDLAAFIAANNPNNVKDIIVTNNLTQPTLNSGNLSGLTVQLINNGQFQGTTIGANGMNLTSSLKLTNHGWIRGAGGNGGNGGRGGTGGTGGKGKDTSYTTNEKEVRGFEWVEDCSVWRPCLGPGGTLVAWKGTVKSYTGVNTSGPYTIDGVSGLYRGDYVGERLEAGTILDNCAGTMSTTYKIERRYTVDHDIIGGAGGSGGAGGNGSAGGKGIYFQNSNTVAANGSTGSTGSNGSISSPSGGNSGGKGGTGGTGGKGGAGGSWGSNGATGSKGLTGATGATGAGGGAAGAAGASGANGVAGTAAGKAITGIANYAAGSTQGSISGAAT